MSWLWVAGFGGAIAAFLTTAAYFYSRATSAKRSVGFLQRLEDGFGAPEEDIEEANRRSPLAASPRLRRLMRNMPLTDSLAHLLGQAGLGLTVAALLGRMGAVAGLSMGVCVLVGLKVAASFFVGLAMASLPIVYVMWARDRRAAAFEAQLPQVMELISLYLRSGRSLPQAFVGATEEIAPASEEFRMAAEEYRLGRPLDASLKRVAAKYPGSVGFRLFVVAVSVLGQTGGNLVEVLDRIKKTLDAGVTYALRLRALTSESRMSAWILGCLPGIFLLITASLNPEYFNVFFDSTQGNVMFGSFLLIWSVGIFWIRSLMSSKLI